MADVAPMTPKKALYAGHLSVTAFDDILTCFYLFIQKIRDEIRPVGGERDAKIVDVKRDSIEIQKSKQTWFSNVSIYYLKKKEKIFYKLNY